MFERFTNRARRVLVVAQEEALNLNYSFIEPEHLLVGLVQGDGVAAQALGQLRVSLAEVRARMAGPVAPAEAGTRWSKVPFSPRAKKALEMSLREALRLGHKHIGTEHLVLGVLQVADADAVKHLLGIDADEVRARVLEVMTNGPTAGSRQSPALAEVMQRARRLGGSGPTTTGQLLLAMVADDGCQAARALQMLGVSAESLEAQLAQIPIGATSDAPPGPRAVEIKLGQLTTTIEDADLAATLARLTPEQLGAALRDAFGTSPGRRASGTGS